MAKPIPQAGASALLTGGFVAAVSIHRLLGSPIYRWERALPHQDIVEVANTIVLVGVIGLGIVLAVRDYRLLARARAEKPLPAHTKGGREVWFERWGGGYNPVHWKGWAVIGLACLGVIIGGILADIAKNLIGHPEWRLAIAPPMLLSLGWGAWTVERHCAPGR